MWSRCQVLWWWGWWHSNLFLPLFLAWALFSLLTPWPFRDPVESPKPAENPHGQNNKKSVLCHFSRPNWLILKEGNGDMGLRRLRMRGWRSTLWQRWAMKSSFLSSWNHETISAQLCPWTLHTKPPKWCTSSSLRLSLHVINLTLTWLI